MTMLSYYVEWHMREAWRDLTFSDPELAESKKNRDPVKKAEKSARAKKKASSKKTDDAEPTDVHPFNDILYILSTISEVQLVVKSDGPDKPDIPLKRIKEFTPLQKKAFDLLKSVPKYPSTRVPMRKRV
jgi:hypothetical protein